MLFDCQAHISCNPQNNPIKLALRFSPMFQRKSCWQGMSEVAQLGSGGAGIQTRTDVLQTIHFLAPKLFHFSKILAGKSLLLLLFNHSVTSEWPHGLQHPRLPCPSLSPGVCSNSCPSSQWYHPTISSSVIPFSSCLKSFPALGSFPVS